MCSAAVLVRCRIVTSASAEAGACLVAQPSSSNRPPGSAPQIRAQPAAAVAQVSAASAHFIATAESGTAAAQAAAEPASAVAQPTATVAQGDSASV